LNEKLEKIVERINELIDEFEIDGIELFSFVVFGWFAEA